MARVSIDMKSGDIEKTTELVVGIDLGTTNSLVAFVKDGVSTCVKDENGKNTLVPSAIFIDEDDRFIIGDKALTNLEENPERTIYSVKRLLGKSFKDVEDYKSHFSYEIIDNPDDTLVKIKVGNTFYSPVQLSSYILKALKERVQKATSQDVSKCVITVPAYFNDAQRQATRDAGKLAGLEVLRIINEPTAASLAYGIGHNPIEEKTIAVYDLGGGTFDVSILKLHQGIFEVLSTHGDSFLGGDDFDQMILNTWADKYPRLKNLDNEGDKQSLRLLAIEAKKRLSFEPVFKASFGQIELELTLEGFETIISPLVGKTIKSCDSALTDSGLSKNDIDEVVLVGGSTRIPLVKKEVSKFFGVQVNDSLNPDEVVALGAAVQGDILSGNRKDILLLDITPLSLGIETVGGLMDVIIPRNSKVPHRAGRQYTTSVDGQTNLKVAVYQGERDLVEDNRKLGEFILKGIPPYPAGIPKIEIHFILDADGILKVKAKELRSNTETQIEIRSQYGISEEEMAKMLLDSIKNAESDMKVKALLESRNEADNVILSANKFLDNHVELLNSKELKEFNTLLESLITTRNKEDKDAIERAMHSFNQFTAPFAQKAMESSIKKALSGQKIDKS